MSPSYVYSGLLRQLPSSVTCWVDVDLGFRFWSMRRRLRLATIDGMEVRTEAGHAAAAHVQTALIAAQGALPVVLQTRKVQATYHACLTTDPHTPLLAQRYRYAAQIQRLVDADTVRCDTDLGFDVWFRNITIRLADVNAPELVTPAGQEAFVWLQHLLAPWGPMPLVTLQTRKDREDNYGRYLGILTTASEINVNDALLQSGHAVPYKG